jgi:TetR/AcrR family tetracycline transcriptional repressor
MTDAKTPRRGRPPKLSREQITRDVADLLLADPAVPLTIARVAEAIGSSPMSLYRHFTDREDLVASVARHLLIDERPAVSADAPWQEQVRVWMHHIYAQAIRVPQLTQLIASGESRAWVTDSAYLASMLSKAGMDDDRRLAEAVYWIATTALGQAVLDAMGRKEFPMAPTSDALVQLGDADAAIVRRLLPHFEAMHHQHLTYIVEWTIAGLEQELERPSA